MAMRHPGESGKRPWTVFDMDFSPTQKLDRLLYTDTPDLHR